MDSSLDKFLNGKIRIYQHTKGYRAGIDSVILAASVKCKAGDTVIDAGSGTGVISYCLAFRCDNIKVIGVEKNFEYYSLAKKSMTFNSVNAKIDFLNKDFINIINMQSDIIVSNPPWFKQDSSFISKNDLKNDAKIESLNLDEWIQKVIGNLKDRGEYYTIFPYSRIKEIIEILKKYFDIIKTYPISSFEDKLPDRAIIYAKKMANKTECIELNKIIIHKNDKSFMNNINDVLRKGSSLSLA